ncbi:hypothetical protein CTI14_44985, partial [Methylobacterium radiotolerans]
SRPPFTILYLAFNQAIPELQDPKVREALSYAIDKDALISQVLPEGTEKATQFVPPVVQRLQRRGHDLRLRPGEGQGAARGGRLRRGEPAWRWTSTYPVNVSRPPFTILYLAFNQAIPELQDPKVREALSYAID